MKTTPWLTSTFFFLISNMCHVRKIPRYLKMNKHIIRNDGENSNPQTKDPYTQKDKRIMFL